MYVAARGGPFTFLEPVSVTSNTIRKKFMTELKLCTRSWKTENFFLLFSEACHPQSKNNFSLDPTRDHDSKV